VASGRPHALFIRADDNHRRPLNYDQVPSWALLSCRLAVLLSCCLAAALLRAVCGAPRRKDAKTPRRRSKQRTTETKTNCALAAPKDQQLITHCGPSLVVYLAHWHCSQLAKLGACFGQEKGRTVAQFGLLSGAQTELDCCTQAALCGPTERHLNCQTAHKLAPHTLQPSTLSTLSTRGQEFARRQAAPLCQRTWSRKWRVGALCVPKLRAAKGG